MDTLRQHSWKNERQIFYYEVPAECIDIPAELRNCGFDEWKQLNFTVKEETLWFRTQAFNFLDNYENIGNILWAIKTEKESIQVIMEDKKGRYTYIIVNNKYEFIKQLKVSHLTDFCVMYKFSEMITKFVVIQTGEQMNFYYDVTEHERIKSTIAKYGIETEYYTYELDL